MPRSRKAKHTMRSHTAKDSKSANDTRKGSRVGRPPRVSTQAIIAAAIEIGLEGVTLKRVADQLGVAVPTLYKHIRSRDELVRMAAFELTLKRRAPEREDLHWSEIATGYALSLYESFVAEPQLVHELMKGTMGPDLELDFLERFLDAMTRQGFSLDEGMQLHHAAAMLAIGASVAAISVISARALGAPMDQALREAAAQREAGTLKHTRSVLDTYVNAESRDWLESLRLMLEGIAARRGETLPSSLRTLSSPSPGRSPKS